MERQTIILGAGALGAMYAERFHAAGLPVALLAEGERAHRLRREGVSVNGAELRLPVVGSDTPSPGLLIVALKHGHLEAALPTIRRVAGPQTTIFSVMNGIDSETHIARAIGEPVDGGRVLHCMVAGMDAVRDGHEVRYTRIGTVFIGDRIPREGAPSPHLAAAQSDLHRAGIPWKTPHDIEHAIWNKFMLNVGINQWSAVLGAPYRVFHNRESARSLMRSAMREVLMIARRRNVALSEDDLEGWFDIVATLGPDNKTSMLQDVEAGRKTEVEMFAGRVVEMGRELDIATPVNETLLDALRAIEEEGLRVR
ncbi:MAG: 2-dehydropantoate 2-reductase [Spirochaetales bacterium]|nr:2-dehydropantoate 2-reductase [Spirochaetales bacterium]